ncbi:hypothetical protein KDX10_32820 [Burkholderia cenocepacia]|uniref:hypothetical protein n=1 Tax=Burkholderia cenocepacia TaxID=95486 RepID=UPI001B950078|nr:hypothetical protein [Burkholderia cenocepacia]MBR8114427.1 hypothetical protein [Burkholderia cenocepacia]
MKNQPESALAHELTVRARINDAARAAMLPFVPAGSTRSHYRIRMVPGRWPYRVFVERRFAVFFWRSVLQTDDIDKARVHIHLLSTRARWARIKPKTVAHFDADGKEI